jgi:hypothetical protein
VAHWAKLDESNIVSEVIVGNNNEPDEGYQWIIDNVGGTWIKTSYNSYGGKHWKSEYEDITLPDGEIVSVHSRVESGQPHLRYNFAGPGYLYDPIRDAFIPPKPYDSWLLNEEACLWESPVPYPNDGKSYIWNEENINWEEIVVE